MFRKIVLTVLSLILTPVMVWADGSFYSTEGLRPELTDQRAVIAFDGNRQVLILQSRFDGRPGDFGWVVPVPQARGLFALNREEAQDMFWSLAVTTRPLVRPVYAWLGAAILGAVLLYSLYLSFRTKSAGPGCLSLGIIILALIAIPNFSGPGGVEVLEDRQIGPYQVKVIRGGEGKAVREWLAGAGYAYGPEDEAVLDRYARQGWSFVTARFRPETMEAGPRSGMVDALVMGFPTGEAVYPLALTGVSGLPTRVGLWILAPFQMSADDRFRLQFAGESERALTQVAAHLEACYPGDASGPGSWRECRYLTRLEADLTAEDMKTDARFVKSEQTGPFREIIIGGVHQGLLLLFVAALVLLADGAHILGLRSRARKKGNRGAKK